MSSRVARLMAIFVLAAAPVFLAGCSTGSTSSASSGTTTQAQDGTVNMMVSDASTEDWAEIGVKVLSIALVPQGGGTNVTVYTAPSPAPTINLVQLDQLGEILGNLTVPVGTYTGVVLTVSGNASDIQLTTSADPSAALLALAKASTAIPTSQIVVQGTTGTAPNLTVPVNVTLVSPLVVTLNSTNALDLEFDLSHPAFLVGHLPNGGGAAIWGVNFSGPVVHHPIPDITRFVLRHHYGTVTSVSSDDTYFTMNKDFPVEPPTSPETAIVSTNSLQILADSTNGTIYYDVDAKAAGVAIKNFSTIATTLPTKYVRVAARYQSNGSLVAVRVWASSTFNSVWISPEGHVLHVNTSTDVITVENELGVGVPLTVNASTQFFFRTPWNAVADATPIATGTGFLTSKDLVRGFKIHASVVDPLASPLVAQTVDVEIARYDGVISNPTANGFTYTRNFSTATDDYVVTLPYILSTSANGNDPVSGAALTGFKWWNFTFPTVLNSGSTAITTFEAATNGTVTFGGTAAPVTAWGATYATWADPVAATGWSVPWVVLEPTSFQLGTAATGYVNGTPNATITMTVPLGKLAVTVDMSTVSGSGTLVDQVNEAGSVITVTPVDITSPTGQTTAAGALLATTPVQVFGVPQANGTIKAYVVFYYTGVKPTAVD